MTQPVLARKARRGEPGWDEYQPGRVYEHPLTGEVAPSITAVQGVIDKPQLDKHLIKKRGLEVAEYVADHRDLVVGDRETLIKDLLAQSEDYEAKPSASPSSIGDTLHDAIDTFAKADGFPSREEYAAWPITAKRMWKQFCGLVEKYNPEFTHTEFTVWSHQHNYAGTADWRARIAGWTVLADTKSGKRVYPEVGIQVAAVNGADTILTKDHYFLGETEPRWRETPMPPSDRFAVLHIRPTYACLIPLLHMDECWETFLAARRIHRWQFETAPRVVGEAPRVSVPIREG